MADSFASKHRAVEREHQPRTLKVGREIEARISKADEDRYADEARELQEAELRRKRAEIERLITTVEDDLAELRRALGRLDRATYRRFDRIRRELGQLRTRFGSADTIGVHTGH